MVISTVSDISVHVTRMKESWGLKKVELDLMEAGVDKEIELDEGSLESQAAGDLVPYELL